jgi:2-polyprenyl-3-methyl-5-hydroxy-6-metoxy-1,4-benzoquinol methylase
MQHAAAGSFEDAEIYYAQARPEMLQFLPAKVERLLDIGCSEGRFGEAVKLAHPGCETWGIEPVAHVAAQAALRNDRVINAAVSPDLDLPSAYFDVVTMNDVLEHIAYPETILPLVKRILAPGGRLVVSLPNVRYYLHVRDFLVHKDWEYQDSGVMDRTHLRFFTEKSARRFLVEQGFDVLDMVGINGRPLKIHYKALFALAPGFFRDMRNPQFAIVAQPHSDPVPLAGRPGGG